MENIPVNDVHNFDKKNDSQNNRQYRMQDVIADRRSEVMRERERSVNEGERIH